MVCESNDGATALLFESGRKREAGFPGALLRHMLFRNRNSLSQPSKYGKSMLCLFLGYSRKSKAYRLFDPTIQKIFRSRDVIFDEIQSQEPAVVRQLLPNKRVDPMDIEEK